MEQEKIQNQHIDIKQFLREVRRYWYLYGIFIFLTFIIAVVVIKYTEPVYVVGSSILVNVHEDSKRVEPQEFLEGFQLVQLEKKFENELLILKSSSLINTVVDDLNLHIEYYKTDRFSPIELYRDAPFRIILNESHPQLVKTPIYIKFTGSDNFRVSVSESESELYDFENEKRVNKLKDVRFRKNGTLGNIFENDFLSFRILINSNVNINNLVSTEYFVQFKSRYDQTMAFQNNLEVIAQSEESTVANLSFRCSNIEKGFDFVNRLAEVYINKGMEKKDIIAMNTVNYIENQLANISDSLTMTEQELQQFRRSYQVMDIGEKASRIYNQLSNLETKRTELRRQKSYYTQLEEYFDENQDASDMIAPSSLGIQDPILNSLMQELTGLNTQKSNLINNNQERSPMLQTINVQIDNLKQTIKENISFNVNSLQNELDELNEQIAELRYEENRLPQTQRELFGIERKFNLNDAVYTFLLQKRAEAKIAQASNLPDSEVIEPGKYLGRAEPNVQVILAAAVFVALFLPSLIIIIINFFNDSIRSVDDVANITNKASLAAIIHNRLEKNNVVIDAPNSIITESFRKLRTNIIYQSQDYLNKVILVSSSIGEEGKSFIAINLASGFSFLEMKCIILDFDLRKESSFAHELGTSNLLGLGDYLSNEAHLDDIITKTDIPNLDFISSGKIRVNPVELLTSNAVNTLFTALKKHYNIIVIDTPPVGPIADTYLLMHYSDLNLFVVRMGMTTRKVLKAATQEMEQKAIKNLHYIVNDVKPKDHPAGYYGSYKKYGHTKESTDKKSRIAEKV